MGKIFSGNHLSLVRIAHHTDQLKDMNSPRRHEVHEEKPKKNLRVLRVFVVKCLKLMSMGCACAPLIKSPLTPLFKEGN